MARKNSGIFEDLMGISARLPWPVGVGLAVVAYLVLHYFATRTPLTMNPAELKAIGKSIGDGAASNLWTTIAGILQYLVPLAFLVGAGVSVMQKGRRRSSSASDAPSCPKCGGSMVRRTAKSGSKAGTSFWGCSQYPACRGIRN